MKIYFISGSLPEVSCGIGDYVDALARAMARRGHEVVVLTTTSPDLQPASGYRLAPTRTAWPFREAGQIAAEVRRERPDVLHVQFPGVGYGRGFGATFAPWALRLHRHRPLLAATLHEFPRLRPRRRVPLVVAMSACDLVIAPDPIVLASIQRNLRWRPRMKTAMIPVAANVWPDANGAPTGESPKGHELTIGYWGFLRSDKGVDLLLEAFARIRETRQAQLVLAGDPGPDAAYITSLKHHADDLGLSASIRTTGKLSAEGLSAELLSFDACVLPFRDGLSQNRGTYAAAVAHGLYVVTTGLNRHGFESETNTAFVPPNDRDALIAAILDAPEHPRMQSPVVAEDAWNEIADLHLAAYDKARGRR